MSDLTRLTDAEIELVSGGYISQANSSSISQSATASNSGRITATASGSYSTAVAVGAEASNTALVAQENVVSFRFYYW